MEVKAWCSTHKGLRRETNQDSYLVNDVLSLYIVADGMGGHSGGEIASQLAVVTAQDVIQKGLHSATLVRDLIQQAYQKASQVIFESAHREGERLAGMGTTMVMVLIWKDVVYIGNVGDSRAYLFRKPHLWQITEDHSFINEQARAGIDVKNLPIGKNVITRSVGFEKEVVADILERTAQPGDNYLLCSDGLSGLVSDERLATILNTVPPDKVVSTCIQEALDAGGIDNITVMYISIT
ncbi:MAG: protein phosphatase 2C domain-containing protein [Bdellovibrionaceae bacterium]|nr:protein phosphatase 2C domain-containing protein [Pseudobdellovibrionaceae bacterium]MDW8189533.1 protein phosphatase 2C domain-containing protein [Pseudobdellovibrionaceae bacterium]